MKKIIAILVAIMMVAAIATVASAKAVQVGSGSADYHCIYWWSNSRTGDELTVEFDVYGKAGTVVSMDLDDGTQGVEAYTIVADNTWEHVVRTVKNESTSGNAAESSGTGSAFRLYNNTQADAFVIDNLKMTVKGADGADKYAAEQNYEEAADPTVWAWGSWNTAASIVDANSDYVAPVPTADYIGIAAVVAAVALVGTAVVISKKH